MTQKISAAGAKLWRYVFKGFKNPDVPTVLLAVTQNVTEFGGALLDRLNKYCVIASSNSIRIPPRQNQLSCTFVVMA
jgi:hypothetical protein